MSARRSGFQAAARSCGRLPLATICRACGVLNELVALPFSCQQPINRETVILARQYQDKEHQCEPRNHMRVKLVKGFSQKMAESDNGQNEAESDQCLTSAEAQNY